MTAQPNPLPCGCRAMMHLDTGTGQGIYIRQCALHEAAGEMLATLTDIEHATARGWNQYRKAFLAATLNTVCEHARAAILKARGAA